MSPNQILCGKVQVMSFSGAKPVRNRSKAGRPTIRIVFSNPTAVAELNVKDVMSICAARMKQNNDHRIGSKNTPAANTQNSARATSSASSGMGPSLRVQSRPARYKFRDAVTLHIDLRALPHASSRFDRHPGESRNAIRGSVRVALHQ